jgi:hypothetical protein
MDMFAVIRGLQHPNFGIQEKAAVVFGFMPREFLIEILTYYEGLSVRVKWMLVPMMGALEFYQPFELLLKEYAYSPDLVFVEALFHVLCNVEYTILPLLIFYFDSEDEDVVIRAKRLLRGLGLEKVRLYLLLSPVILHELVFRDVFGDAAVDAIRGERY